MEKKKFSEIRISDIIKEAGVAKVSYYRNFNSIEDVIQSFFDRMNDELAELMTGPKNNKPENIRKNLITKYNYFLSNRKKILLLCENGFYEKFLENVDNFFINELGDMPQSSIERYNLYLLSGAVCHCEIEWLKNDKPESPEAFADFNMRFIETNSKLLNLLGT